jgi:cellobiose phosphorylase
LDLLDEIQFSNELLPPDRLEAHAASIAATHRAVTQEGGGPSLLTALDRCQADLEAANGVIAEAAREGQELVAAEMWLRDNFHIAQYQVREVRQDLPRRYYAELPKLIGRPWAGLPRVYGLAIEYMTHTETRFDGDTLARFVERYQEVTPLAIGELWAIPIMLRLALLERLRRLARATVAARESRHKARAWASLLSDAASAGPEAVRSVLSRRRRTEVLDGARVVELVKWLRDQSPALAPAWQWLEERLGPGGIDREIQLQQHREATDQLAIANTITSMRLLSSADWRTFIERASLVERTLRQDPAEAYASMDFATRDRYRQSVEAVARRSEKSEIDIARLAVEQAALAKNERPGAGCEHHVGYYLISRGRFQLERLVRYRPTARERVARRVFQRPTIGYLGMILVFWALGLASLLAYASRHGASPGLLVAVALATIIPLSEAAIGLVNRIVATLVSPRALPKLSFREGIPADFRTMVVVPTIISSGGRITELVDGLQVRFLANRDDHLHFALLTDLPDAAEAVVPGDEELVALAIESIAALNRQYGADRFFLFHRARRWNAGENRWMGWERKRGKLEEFGRLLRGAADTSFDVQVGELSILGTIRFVITLDSDTQLPIDTGRQLVGTLAHPLNRPRVDPRTQRVVDGYGIIQPRIGVDVVSANRTTFARVFSGHVGMDPYTTAVSDVYQDLFHEGNYVGKGIYDVDAFGAALAERVPENTLLSHDLFEGLFARVALCTDIQLLDEYPPSYLAFAARQHRWARGDWQLLPWLGRRVPDRRGGRVRNSLPFLARWKLLDNLRRTLLAPALVLLLVAGWLWLPGWAGTWMILTAFVLASPAYEQIGRSLDTRVRGVSLWAHLKAEQRDWALAARQVILTTAFLPSQAYLMADAIVRTLVRIGITWRRRLEWQPAADAVACSIPTASHTFARMWPAPVAAVSMAAALSWLVPTNLGWAMPVLALWALSPVIAYRTALPTRHRVSELGADARASLRRLARRTWRYYEELVGPADHWLVPDNHQENRAEQIAHRTSPTNIGLQLLAGVAARDSGYLTSTDLVAWLDRIWSTLGKLPRHRGHLLNWYDTRTLAPLAPAYVSTVDSGNLGGYLLTLRMALIELADEPILTDRWLAGLDDTLSVLDEEIERAVRDRLPDGARRARAEIGRLRARLSAVPIDLPQWATLLAALRDGLEALRHLVDSTARSSPTADVAFWIERAVAAVGAADADRRLAESMRVKHATGTDGPDRTAIPSLRKVLQWTESDLLDRLTHSCEAFLQEMDFSFLFDRERQLFGIGYRVAEGRLDESCYDNLASEARLASFLTIALRKAPHEHWFKLGRAITAVGSSRALVSWSGSMFEYLMPMLVMRTYPNTLLDETYGAAVERQIAYASERGVPWGMSESAYNLQDVDGNYQYKAFGVPGLGLKPGLADDLVVAPYASALALAVDPHRAVDNLNRLRAVGLSGRFGLFEAIDYTRVRLPAPERSLVLPTYMAHHQGMTLVAVVNCLRDNPMPRRFHADPRVQAAELLLQEHIPHLVPFVEPPIEHVEHVRAVPPLHAQDRRYETPHTSSPRTHLLSNGSYLVVLTNAGGGYSARQGLALTRWREDRTCDNWGSFCYVRDLTRGRTWSTGFQPTLVEPDDYEVTMAPDRVLFRRRDGDIETLAEVAVSPEDDVEVRRITVTNASDDEREIDVTTYSEVVLAGEDADAAHPAFGNLFVETWFVPERRALVCRRRPRGEEPELYLWHQLAASDAESDVEFETDRRRFLGRGQTAARPLALRTGARLAGRTGAVLDPIISLRRRATLAPRSTLRLHFITGFAESPATLQALLDQYGDWRAAERVLDLASAQSHAQLRLLNLAVREVNVIQRLAGRLIYCDPRLRVADALEANRLAQDGLWKFGISGDLPIVIVRVRESSQLALVRELLRAHEYCRLKSFRFDLVALNEDPTGYRQELQDQILSLLLGGPSGALAGKPGGVFLLRADTLTSEEETLLTAVARVVMDPANGSLADQLELRSLPVDRPPKFRPRRVVPEPPAGPSRRPRFIEAIAGAGRRAMSFLGRKEPSGPLLPIEPSSGHATGLRFDNGFGGFSPDGREYVIRVDDVRVTPAPWANVIANRRVGCLTTERGLGCTWSENSRLNRLTPWSNDPVSDPPSEALFLRDSETGDVWSVTPAPRSGRGPYIVRHGPGYTCYEHAEAGLATQLLVFVPEDDPVKILQLHVSNPTARTRRVAATFYAEWVLGDLPAKFRPHVVTSIDPRTGALMARNGFREVFGQRVAFVDADRLTRSVTADRISFIGRNGSLAQPAALTDATLDGRCGAALDPCAALQVEIDVAPEQTAAVTFVFGEAIDLRQARALIVRYRDRREVQRAFDRTRRLWEELLGAVTVKTPDDAMDLMLNGWLLYQAVACRLWGRSGFYQSSGAFGFRDQVQDVLALMFAAPGLARDQLLRAASRQFLEGDVQHWWHEPDGRGVRTRCSDDRLWLPYGVLHYVHATGDRDLLDQSVPFLDAPPLAPDEDERYFRPETSRHSMSVYEHCVRAIQVSLAYGAHGLPLMGTGDWNDGMNLVGRDGRGESVWLGWFLVSVLNGFADVADARRDSGRARDWRLQASRLQRALEGAWDGDWYRRAYFDDGTPLGAKTNREARIDSIAQSWAVLSSAAEPARARQAMQAVLDQLVKQDDRIVLLLRPPFVDSVPNPGYIRGYLPGVRENGGQYTHAAAWVILALGKLGAGDEAARLFSMINPIAHGGSNDAVARYLIEPYVVAGDVYSVDPNVGRGGWSWYTGSASWLYRAGLEGILGVSLADGALRVDPCIPRGWSGYQVAVRRGATTFTVTVENPEGVTHGIARIELDGVVLPDALIPLVDDGRPHDVRVRLGRRSPAPVANGAAELHAEPEQAAGRP